MGRKTVYNTNVSRAWDGYDDEHGNHIEVSKENKDLVRRYLAYCKANDRSAKTIHQYEAWLKVFFSWNAEQNDNKFFVDMDVTDFMMYIGYLRDLEMSPHRVAALKSVLSSLSLMIQRMYRKQYPTFRNQVSDLEAVHIEPVREKTVMSTEEVDDTLDKLVAKGYVQEACYLALDCSCGARKAELIQMKTSWFGKGADVHTVFNDYMYMTPKIRTKGRGKLGKMISKYVIKAKFSKYFDLWMQKRQELGITSEWLFVNKNRETGIWEQADVHTADKFARHITEVSGKDFYTHSGRHYFCTMLKSMKLPNDVIQEIFGWSSDMIPVYDDTPAEERLANFFAEFTAKQKEAQGGNKEDGTAE